MDKKNNLFINPQKINLRSIQKMFFYISNVAFSRDLHSIQIVIKYRRADDNFPENNLRTLETLEDIEKYCSPLRFSYTVIWL